MPKRIAPKSATAIKDITEPGFHCVSENLYLKIAGGGRSWVFRYVDASGHRRDLGLGAYPRHSVHEARDKVHDYLRGRRAGIDPLADREREREERQRPAANAIAEKSIHVDAAIDFYYAAKAREWSKVHANQFKTSMRDYVRPTIGAMPIAEVDLPAVLRVLEPIWNEKTETANRVRRRLEAVLDWAKVRGYRQGDNPARWSGHLATLLPAREKIAPTVHHPALPYAELADFTRVLRGREGTAARALEFAILTCARTSEVRFATWNEINEGDRVWTVPAERMKGGKEHRVPLSDRAFAVLQTMKAQRTGNAIFPGRDAEFINMTAMIRVLRAINNDGLTVHGFRSSFSDWATERTPFAEEVREWCLAHITGDKSAQAYRRADAVEKRRQLLTAWAAFIDAPSTAGQVVPFPARA